MEQYRFINNLISKATRKKLRLFRAGKYIDAVVIQSSLNYSLAFSPFLKKKRKAAAAGGRPALYIFIRSLSIGSVALQLSLSL